jgi:hypothetical protein
MAISVGDQVFDATSTVAREEYEMVGGKQTRAIRITGLVRGTPDLAELIETLDSIARSASEVVPAEVSLREGRRLFARREGFSRELSARSRVGCFVLDLRADDAWEESEALHESPWDIGFSGATIELSNSGNVAAMPVVTLTAESDLELPTLSDGTRSLTYEGTAPGGATLVFDAALRRVLLDGVDVTPYTTGDFPQLALGNTTLEYTGDPSGSHFAGGVVAFRDRWW